MQFEIHELGNGLPVILAPEPETPRMALAVCVRGGVSREPQPGMAKLSYRLLQKGTERRSTEQLLRELDDRAIELRDVVHTDYSVMLAVFLNHELPAALDILEDIHLHSTFADFSKEQTKFAGEIQASLDSPSAMCQDLLGRSLFPNHPYGNTGTRILEAQGAYDEQATHAWYDGILQPRQMNVTLVGDFVPDQVLKLLEERFGSIQGEGGEWTPPPITRVDGDRVETWARPEANQANITRGWYAPPFGAPQEALLKVMNTLLGGGGLSNRLFVELRDKLGLAYSVYSHYAPMGLTGEFLVSIGTSPENIAKARQGFADQIARIQQEPITSDELRHAVGRMQGTYVLGHETTSQQCMDLAIGHITGRGPDYSARLLERIGQVAVDDVQSAAQLIHPPSVTAIVAREEALAGIKS